MKSIISVKYDQMEREKSQEEAVDKIVAAIEQKLAVREGPLLVSIDGRSGTGKTTLGKAVAEKIGATFILGDDFYAGGTFKEWSKKTPKQKADFCIDWKRIRKEALEPLLAGRSATWHPFNWQTNEGLADNTITAKPAKVIILDVVYAARPELADLIDFSVLLQVSEAARRIRIAKRESGSFMKKWHKVWDDAEDYYFSQVRPPLSFDLVVQI